MIAGLSGLALAATAMLAAAQQQWRPPAPASARLVDWRDAPLSQGWWSLRQGAGGSSAQFAPAAGASQLVLRCDRARRSVRLTLYGAAPAARPGAVRVVVVRTSSLERRVAASGSAAISEVELQAADPLLDAVVFSRGRWALGVEAPAAVGAMAPLVLPVAAEVARIVEDCRN